MAITFLEAGAAATYGTEFWTAVVAGPAASTTFVHTGPRSLKIPEYKSVRIDSVTPEAGARINCYALLSALPATGTNIFGTASSINGNQMEVRVKSTGVLTLRDANGTLHDGTTVLSATTWYRLCLAYTYTSNNVSEWRLYLNGVLERSVTNPLNMVRSGTSQLFFENTTAGQDVYFSDIYVDDSTALTDTGDIRVTAKLPAANNTNSFNTAVGNNPANRWENVNERALSQTNAWRETGTGGVQENFGLQAASAGDVDLTGVTLVGRCAWIWAKITVASVLAKIMDNGTESAVTLTTSPALYTLLTTSASYPSDAAGIGIRSSTTAETFLYECGMIIAYTPAAAGAAEDPFPILAGGYYPTEG